MRLCKFFTPYSILKTTRLASRKVDKHLRDNKCFNWINLDLYLLNRIGRMRKVNELIKIYIYIFFFLKKVTYLMWKDTISK